MRGIDAGKQELVDAALRDADGTPSLSRLGAVSVASVLAAAAAAGQPRYRAAAPENSTAILPLPMINIISGGAHTGRSLDIQDLLVLPVGAERFAEAIEMAWRVRRGSAAALDARRVSRA